MAKTESARLATPYEGPMMLSRHQLIEECCGRHKVHPRIPTLWIYIAPLPRRLGPLIDQRETRAQDREYAISPGLFH